MPPEKAPDLSAASKSGRNFRFAQLGELGGDEVGSSSFSKELRTRSFKVRPVSTARIFARL